MIRVFIGFDQREAVAYHVAVASIMRHASEPVSITPLARGNLRHEFARPRGPLDSTDFAISRFLVPHLCGFEGRAIFIDCDMLLRADIAQLWHHVQAAPALRERAVCVVQHDYVPATARKFLGHEQTRYHRKNWSSVIAFNNPHCHALTREYVERAPGLDLHQFAWLPDDAIGALPREWNCLVGEDNQCAPADAKLLHFTLGTPCFSEFAACEMAHEWHAARAEANAPMAI